MTRLTINQIGMVHIDALPAIGAMAASAPISEMEDRCIMTALAQSQLTVVYFYVTPIACIVAVGAQVGAVIGWCVPSMALGAVPIALVVERRLGPRSCVVAVRALAAIVVGRAVAFHAIGDARVVECHITPIIAVMAFRAGTRMVATRCLVAVALAAGTIVGVVEGDLLPIVSAMAVGAGTRIVVIR
jgi:hypothetical protein